MAAVFSDPRLNCWICGTNPATRVIEAKALVDHAAGWDVQSFYQLCCDQLVCVWLSAVWADARDSVHVDTRPLTKAEAEAISGLDFSEVSAP